ncbi:uncharacterized protein LOC133712938 isoform X2 [Rosa rugosa]|uniref:uncharacterized protein LOC133712938 isoform X2 n=1 Tax=Rosa rugosa TaxID=74645 RepID=UPI002B4107FA|nr:uncharacterized protein LOC133712938 isoform X2 [Rosa rugosa]
MPKCVGIGLGLPHRLPYLASVYSCSSSYSTTSAVGSVPNLAKVVSKWNSGGRAPRRLVLGLAASFWAQLMNMSGAIGGKAFTASARLKSGPSFEEILKNVDWPEQIPYKPEDFQRYDESPDTLFYESPRFVTHIDDPAIVALTKYYSKVFPPSNTPGVSMLDMCSSWVLTQYVLQDLNVNPKLPFEDNSFDVITNVVSVDYINKPIEVFKEMCRILKPGGLAIISFSNRCFWTKAISIWTSTGDADHGLIVGSYFHYAGGFEPPQGVDISPNPGRSDPMYIVYSRKLSSV